MISGKQSRGPHPVNSHVSIFTVVQRVMLELMERITDRSCPYKKILAHLRCQYLVYSHHWTKGGPENTNIYTYVSSNKR